MACKSVGVRRWEIVGGNGDIAGCKVGNEGKLIEDAGGEEGYGKERGSNGVHFGGVVDGD